MNGELPQGWSAATLGDICSKPQYGWTCRAAKTGKLKYVRTTDISNGGIDWASVPYCEDVPVDIEKYRVRANDILVSRAGSVGVSFRVADVPHDAVFASYLIRFKPLNDIPPKYVEFFLKSDAYWRSISEFTAGIAIPNVNASKLASLELPLAPIAEQRRIVAKLETLLAKVDACQKRSANIPDLLKRIRHSVLNAACSGRLTADWREQNPHEEVEDNRAPSDAPDVPESWQWKHLSEISELRGGVTKGRRFNGRKTIQLPYLRVANVQDGYLDLEEIKLIEALPEDKDKYALKAGDLLFTEGGDRDKLGRGTVWRDEIPDCIHQNHIFRARLATKELVPDYVSFATKSDFARRYFFDNASQTVNLASINLTMLGALPVAIPPPAEQEEIVRRVQALFSFAAQIEVRYGKAQAYVGKLVPSLLAKAFRGELVPTEAELARQERRDYEPASVLLERIQRERNAGSSDTREEPPPRAAKRRSARAATKSKGLVTEQRRRVTTSRRRGLVREG